MFLKTSVIEVVNCGAVAVLGPFPFSFSQSQRAKISNINQLSLNFEMVSQDLDHRFPENVGILAMDAYFPSTYVEQSELGKISTLLILMQFESLCALRNL